MFLLLINTANAAKEILKKPFLTKVSATKTTGLKKTLTLLVLVNIMWGVAWLPYKIVFEQLPVPMFAALRTLLVSLVLMPFALLDLRRHVGGGGQKPGLKNMPRLLLLALFGVVLNNLFVFNGASLATATDASLLAITETLFTALLAWLFLKERFPASKVAGLALGAFGVYLLVAKGLYLPRLGNGGQVLGDLMLLLGFGFEAIYTLLATGSVRRFPPLVVLVGTNLVSLLFWGPAALFSLAQLNWTLPTLNWQGLVALAYLILMNGALGYTLWLKALRRAEPGLVSITLFIQPLIGMLVGMLFLNETLTGITLVGGALVIAGLSLIVPGAAHSPVTETATCELGSNGGPAYAEVALAEPERERLGRALSEALALNAED